MGEKKTNYDKMREDAEQRFLAYDQEKMIRKFQLVQIICLVDKNSELL